MIKRIARKNLDLEKYTTCLANAINYHIYGEYWYLDALIGNNWDCYIWNDYEAIMPIPFAKKIGIKYIIQPIYCQQLGVFHSENFSKEVFHQFEKKLHKNLVRSYHFNEENTAMFSPKGNQKINQILDISTSYDELYKNFNSNRKRNIKSFEKNDTIIRKDFDLEKLIDFKIKNTSYKVDHKTLLNLLRILCDKKLMETFSAFKENELLGFCIFIKSKNRSVYINSSTNDFGRKKSVATGLLHQQIKDTVNTNVYLDFEGSSIPTIHQFFKSFGAKNKVYTVYKNFI